MTRKAARLRGIRPLAVAIHSCKVCGSLGRHFEPLCQSLRQWTLKHGCKVADESFARERHSIPSSAWPVPARRGLRCAAGPGLVWKWVSLNSRTISQAHPPEPPARPLPHQVARPVAASTACLVRATAPDPGEAWRGGDERTHRRQAQDTLRGAAPFAAQPPGIDVAQAHGGQSHCPQVRPRAAVASRGAIELRRLMPCASPEARSSEPFLMPSSSRPLSCRAPLAPQK